MNQENISLGRGIGRTMTMKPRQKMIFFFDINTWQTWETPEELFEMLFGPGIRDRY